MPEGQLSSACAQDAPLSTPHTMHLSPRLAKPKSAVGARLRAAELVRGEEAAEDADRHLEDVDVLLLAEAQLLAHLPYEERGGWEVGEAEQKV